MIDRRLLKSEIVKNGMTQTEFCRKICMAQSTFIRKLRLGNFTTNEAERMIKVLGIENPAEIFFMRVN